MGGRGVGEALEGGGMAEKGKEGWRQGEVGVAAL